MHAFLYRPILKADAGYVAWTPWPVALCVNPFESPGQVYQLTDGYRAGLGELGHLHSGNADSLVSAETESRAIAPRIDFR